jgi:hypothetical protein
MLLLADQLNPLNPSFLRALVHIFLLPFLRILTRSGILARTLPQKQLLSGSTFVPPSAPGLASHPSTTDNHHCRT